MSMKEILEKNDKVKPIGMYNGTPVVSFEDQVAMAEYDLSSNIGLSPRTMNANGTIARSRTKSLAVSPSYYYMNRYKVARGKLLVVVDYRAIKEQDTNRVYRKQIPAYQFARDKDTNQLVLEKVVQISDAEFVADFTSTLDYEAMSELKPMIEEFGVEIQKDSMPI